MDEQILNEFRRDLVSGDWVLFSTVRKHTIKKFEDSYQPKENCPFEAQNISKQEIIRFYPSPENWFVALLENKYPAVKPGSCGPVKMMGPFETIGAFGFHEIVVTRDHDRNFDEFTTGELAQLFEVFKNRYLEIIRENCGEYISIFHNHGKGAGASIYHPHSQIISTPILPPDIMRSIKGSEEFYKKNHKKVHDVMLEWEMERGGGIIEENSQFLAFCPFVSKKPYEIRVFSKRSSPRFESISEEEVLGLASILKSILQRMNKLLQNPPYNLFIHTAPVKEDAGMVSSEYYHWHMEIIPHLVIDAGFEMGTGIDVNPVDPDIAAKELRSI